MAFYDSIIYPVSQIRLTVSVCEGMQPGEMGRFNTTLEKVAKSYDGGDPYEWQICVQEALTEITKLKVGESMYFQPNRDDPNSKGLILRTE